MTPRSARELALVALWEWRDGRHLADAILHHLLARSSLASADRAFATELFYGVLRNLTLLDFWLAAFRDKPLDAEARDLLRVGLYQIHFLAVSDHASVFETVALAGARRRPLINAILRTALRRQTEMKVEDLPLATRFSHPQFLIDRWSRRFRADEVRSLCHWNNQPPPTYARINQLRITLPQFLARYPGSQSLPKNAGFVSLGNVADPVAAGDCYIQDPSTALACELLAPQSGETVLDACAAPGGKTAYLAQQMCNAGSLLATDRNEERLAMLRRNIASLGITNIQVEQHDWSKNAASSATPDHFDRILVDAPCSNTGVMRRRLDVRWRLTPHDFPRMHREQLAITRGVMPSLKAGGTLVYSTCSIEAEENEQVVDALLQEFPSLELLEKKSVLPFRDGFDGAFAAKFCRKI